MPILITSPSPDRLDGGLSPRKSAVRSGVVELMPSQNFALENFNLDAFVAATLAEDLGDAGGLTGAAVIPADACFTGVMDSRDAITVAGLPIAEAFFRALDPEVRIERL